MKRPTMNELVALTRAELLALQDFILVQLLALPHGYDDFIVAEAVLELNASTAPNLLPYET